MNISKIFNANLYIDGVGHIGRASEVKLPELVTQTVEHKALGMAGTLELPAGLQALTMTVKWAGFYAEQIKLGANPFAAHRFQIRANHETYGAAGRIDQQPLVAHVTGSFKKVAPGTYKPQEAAEYDDEIAVTYMKIMLAGQELVEVDVFNNVWRVAGVDVLSTFRKNLG